MVRGADVAAAVMCSASSRSPLWLAGSSLIRTAERASPGPLWKSPSSVIQLKPVESEPLLLQPLFWRW